MPPRTNQVAAILHRRLRKVHASPDRRRLHVRKRATVGDARPEIVIFRQPDSFIVATHIVEYVTQHHDARLNHGVLRDQQVAQIKRRVTGQVGCHQSGLEAEAHRIAAGKHGATARERLHQTFCVIGQPLIVRVKKRDKGRRALRHTQIA